MYNSELKEQYIEFSKERNLILTNIMYRYFDKVEPKEIELGKDCSEFTVEEIIDFYKSLYSSSYETLNNIASQFKIYASFCLSKNLLRDNQNHYNEITKQMIYSCINQGLWNAKILMYEDVLSIVEFIPNPSDQFLVLALFDGICGENMEELVNIKLSDFKDDVVNLCSGRKIKVSPKTLYYASKAEQDYVYVTVRDGETVNEKPFKPEPDYIFKMLCNQSTRNSSNLRSKLRRIKEQNQCDALSAKSLLESGRIYHILKDAKNMDINPENYYEVMKNLIRKYEQTYGRVYSIDTFLMKNKEWFGDI